MIAIYLLLFIVVYVILGTLTVVVIHIHDGETHEEDRLACGFIWPFMWFIGLIALPCYLFQTVSVQWAEKISKKLEKKCSKKDTDKQK